MKQLHESEVALKKRFEFGRNWQNFSGVIDETRLQSAVASLREKLGKENLNGLTFLDIGSGSGLFSLAARKLGAKVTSFDYDPRSVACTNALKTQFMPNDDAWEIHEGSVLDCEFLKNLGKFDIVYSWGVLHHTGAMWTAIENAMTLVHPKGQFFIAIYNYQPVLSKIYLAIKKLYVRSPKIIRWSLVTAYFSLMLSVQITKKLISLIGGGEKYRKAHARGMNLWYDAVDWVGGYPFEVATPKEIVDDISSRGFLLQKIETVGGGLGCNEFVFVSDDNEKFFEQSTT